ncbi:MAG: hypothetical protein AB1898_30590 [Acidobacteriota bacterium]
MSLLKRRIVTDNRITRIYDRGGIFLGEAGESLRDISEGAISEGTADSARIEKCLLCDGPSVHWGFFLTGEESMVYAKGGSRAEATGTFFGLCNGHDPHKDEDEVCDAVYKIMEGQLRAENDLQIAETVMNTWFEELVREGRSRKDSLKTMISLLKAGRLTESYDLSEPVKQAMQIVLQEELQREGD